MGPISEGAPCKGSVLVMYAIVDQKTCFNICDKV